MDTVDILARVKRLPMNATSLLNYFRDHRHIYIDRSEHPFWKTYHSYPPVPYTLRGLADLCHYWNRIPEDNEKAFIVEYEHVLMLSGKSRDYVYMVNAVPAIELQLLSANCKAIVVPSQGALRETMRYIKSPGATEKASVVRPAYPIQPDNEHVQNGPFTIVTIGNKFWGKGIPIAIEVFRVLRERLGANIRMVLVCGDIPAGYVLPQGLLVVSVLNMSEGMRREIYREANVFVFPCLHDSFGVYLEAMAYGVPMIATRIYDKEEVIVDGQTGFLVHTPISMYDGAFGIDWKSWDHFQEVIKTMFERGGFSDMVDDIVSKLELLVNDIGLVRSMGKAAQKLQREYFSPERKNRQIVQIYDRVLRSL